MSELPAPKNTVLDTVDVIIHGIIFDVGVEAALAELVLEFPFLGLPVVKNIVRLIVNRFAGKLEGKLKPFIDASVIKYQNAKDNEDYKKSLGELKAAQESGDKDARDKALAKIRADIDKLINFNK